MQDFVDSELFVFSTQRLVLDFYAKNPQASSADIANSQDLHLRAQDSHTQTPHTQAQVQTPQTPIERAMSVGDFFAHVFFVPDRMLIPRNIQKVILCNIIADMPNITNVFVFEHSFLGYLESSDFLISFFRELTLHNVDLKQIPLQDIYGDYVEHLQILEQIWDRFSQKLQEYKFCATPKISEIQIVSEFLRAFSKVHIALDGFLNPLEIFILQQAMQITSIILHIQIDRYNKEHFKWLGISLCENHNYEIDLASKTILSQSAYPQALDIKAFGFSMRISQASYVLEKIQELLGAGIDADKIAVVLPSKDYQNFLYTLDLARNLNYAMGKSIVDSEWFMVLEKTLSQAESIDSSESYFDFINQCIAQSQISHQIPSVILHKIQEILLQYEPIHAEIQKLQWADFVELFLREIKELSIDDVGGGQIRVMEVLETRGLDLEYVFVVDFNASTIPKVKDSDMFLNSALRQSLDMPTMKDRQDLQKHYYYQLFLRASKARLTYCANDEENPASMIDELGIPTFDGDERFALFEQIAMKPYQEEEIIDTIDSSFVFSYSSLKVLLQCKRKFYYYYMCNLKKPLPPNTNQEIGESIHDSLKEAYGAHLNQMLYQKDIEMIEREFYAHILPQSRIQEFLFEFHRFEMAGFWEYEKQRAQNGFQVIGCEVAKEGVIEGRRVKGRFDRIDIENGVIKIFDYKFQKYPKTDKEAQRFLSLQLGLYTMLEAQNLESSAESRDIEVGAFFLRDSNVFQSISKEALHNAKEEIQSALQESHAEMNFEKADYKQCARCEYVAFCNRA